MKLAGKLLEALGIAIFITGYFSFLAGASLSVFYYDFFIGIGIFYLGYRFEKKVKANIQSINEQQ